MTSKLVVNTIEADTGISSVSFASSISMDSTSKFHFSAAGVDIGADTNINRPAAGVLGFNINGSEKLRITGDGVLKFTGQTSTLETAGLTHHTNNNLYIRGGTLGAILTSVDGNEAWIVQNTYVSASTSGSERLRITSTGDVGINVTPISGVTLQVGTPNSATGVMRGHPDYFSIDSGSSAGGGVVGTASNPALIFGGDGNTGLYHSGSDTLNFTTAGSERLRIDSSGRIGVGVVPTAQFAHNLIQIGNQATLGANAALSTTGQTFLTHNLYFDTGGTLRVFNTSNANEGAIFRLIDGELRFSNSAATTGTPTVTERFRIASDGRVGVGAEPEAKFMVTDASYPDISMKYTGTSGGHNTRLMFMDKRGVINAQVANNLQNDGVGTAAAHLEFATATGGTLSTRMRITDDGYVQQLSNPRFSFARQTGWTTVSGNNTTIAFNQTLSSDPSGSYNSGNGRFTAPIAGSYCFLLLMYTRRDDSSQGDQGWYMNTYIRKNGSSPAYSNNIQHYYNAGDSDTTSNCHMMLDLAANDYVDVVMNTSGTNFRYYGYHCAFSGWLVG